MGIAMRGLHEIIFRQNDGDLIALLALQRVIYSRAKRYYGLQYFLLCAFIFAVLALKQVNFTLFATCLAKPMFVIALILMCADVLISKKISTLKTYAASVQNVFDSSLYGFKNNGFAQHVFSKINKNDFKIDDVDRKALKNWYTVPNENIPSPKSVLICQSSNYEYDSSLNRQFLLFSLILIVPCISIVCAFVFFAWGTNDQFYINAISLLSIIKVVASHIHGIIAYTKTTKSISSDIDRLIKSDSIAEESIFSIQDRIFEARRISQFIPDWFYNVLMRYDNMRSYDSTAKKYAP